MSDQDRGVAGSSDADWHQRLVRCGLEVVGGAAGASGSVQAAIQAAAGVAVEPVVAVSTSSPRALEEFDREWHRHASRASLYSPKGEFLLLPPGSGGSKVGWVRVKDPVGRNLPSRVAAVTGLPELLAVSSDERHVCAATCEEDEYWVIVCDIS